MTFANLVRASSIKPSAPISANLRGGAPSSNNLPVTIPLQLQRNWCWAAVATGVANFFNIASGWSQCRVASKALTPNDCCAHPGSQGCNVPYFLNLALTVVGHYVAYSGVEPMATIQLEIDAGRPVGARIGWAGGGGHFMVIAGYDLVNDSFLILDPIYGSNIVPRVTFETAYQGSGSWSNTFYTS